MSIASFDRDSMAKWYATEHLNTDPGIVKIYYLPTNSGDREIRLLEVNKLMAERTEDALEPIDFGVDRGQHTEHHLFVLDVTPEQWERIESGELQLPSGWSLKNYVEYLG
jgi:hypothetical protein